MNCSGSSFTAAIMFLLFFLAGLPAPLSGQEVRVSYTALEKPFSVVLEELMQQTDLKFAFDAEAFSRIPVSFSVRDEPFPAVADLLSGKYGFDFRFLEGTWIVTRRRGAPLPAAQPARTEAPTPANRVYRGYVTDQATGEPLLYCNIVFAGNRGTITNALGYFGLEIPQGEVSLSVTHLGYHRLDTVLKAGDAMPVRLALKPFTLMVREVSVVLKEKDILETGDQPGRTALNPARSANLPRVASDDLANMLTLIPGVTMLPGRNGGISIRGSNPSENLVLLDGIPLLETGHLFGNISILNAGYIRQAFVSRGGSDARFGDRAAGVIELTGKSGSIPEVDISANLLNGSLIATIPLGSKVSVTGAWRRSYFDIWQNYLFRKLNAEVRLVTSEDNEVVLYPAVRYQDINLKASIHPSPNQEITFGMLRSHDQQMLDYRIDEKTILYRNEWTQGSNTGFSGNYSLQKGDWNHSLHAGYSEFHHAGERESGEEISATYPWASAIISKIEKKIKKVIPNRNKYEFDSDSNRVSEFRVNWRSEVQTGSFRHDVGAGITGNRFEYRFMTLNSGKNIPVDSLRASSEQFVGHFFYQQTITPADFMSVRWGIRSNYSGLTGKIHWQPRFGVEYRPLPDLRFYYNAGVYNQFLSKIPRVDPNGQIGMIWYLPDSAGNGMLRSTHQVAGINWEKKGFLVNAEIYKRETSGRRWLYAKNYRKGIQTRLQYAERQGKSSDLGADLLIQYRGSAWTHQAGWTVSKSEELIYGINDDRSFPSLNDQRHLFRLTEIFSRKGWFASLNWTYHTGQPISVPLAATADQSPGRLPCFSQLDAGIARTVRMKHAGFTGGISLLNLLNRTNVVRVDYLSIVSETEAYNLRSNVSNLSFTPVFFLNIRFF
ncbi:MAG: TonB-dependent receptor plug domain-containing protein [Bacteroidota bacterium]|jgi:hypothetical protein|nr:TonB-dependent receptor plug domain-containing protein [Prolixibacteraceae bacterium]MDI9563193.1 TonB-dependent receptor plug domain-containing protein [Bacteroidota bacterium]